VSSSEASSLLSPVASSNCLWGAADALADYLEAAVYRDYRLFNRRREVSFRTNSAELQGKERLFLTDL
jgi:hypothetical protein